MTVTLRPYRLPFRRPVLTARGRFPARRGWLLRLDREDGARGHGDAAPWPGFTPEYEAVCGRLRAAEGTWPSPDAFLARTAEIVEAEAALELARLDLAAQDAGVPLRDLEPTGSVAGAVRVHAVVNTAEEARAAVAEGFRTLKIKVGATDLTADWTRAVGIRAAVGDEVALRIDANGAYSGDRALRAAEAWAHLRPEFLEQPAADLATCARVRAAGYVRVALDESLTSELDLRLAVTAGALDVAVLKPGFYRSWTAALAAARFARGEGKEVVVTCAWESAVGRWAALHLAAALGGTTAAGLLAPLAADLAPFPVPVDGVLRPSWTTGLGVSPSGRLHREPAGRVSPC